MSAHEDLGNLADLLGFLAASGRERDGVEASYGPAVDAEEVRVGFFFVGVGGDGFESPDVVADFDFPEDTGLGESIEVSEDGGSVDTGRGESFEDFCVG